jgi:glycosyltransferase involved in cell wall biosynthesis
MGNLVGLVGSGMIGRNPEDPACWSGSGYNFFRALRRFGTIECAIGVEARNLVRYAIIARNFRFNRTEWVRSFYLDTSYYKALNSSIKVALSKHVPCTVIQIGSIYDASEACGVDACYSYHDGNVVQLINSGYLSARNCDKAKRVFEWERRVLSGHRKVFTMSEYLRRSFVEDYGLNPGSVINIGVGMNFSFPENLHEKVAEEIFDFLYIGIDFERKGGPLLVEAFDRLSRGRPNVRLNIVGPKVMPVCLRKMENKSIRFWGYLNKEVPEEKSKLNKLLRECHAFVLPSLYEPFGIAALEAMAYGMPVAATNAWAFPEMIRPGVNGALIERGSVDDLYAILESWSSSPDQVFRMGCAARMSVADRFTWSSVAAAVSQEVRS